MPNSPLNEDNALRQGLQQSTQRDLSAKTTHLGWLVVNDEDSPAFRDVNNISAGGSIGSLKVEPAICAPW